MRAQVVSCSRPGQTGETDVARKNHIRYRGELIERLHAVNTRAIDLTEALLLLSCGERGNLTRKSVDPRR
ncbi:hypothetical protein ABZ357_25950 [Streptomyces sp. NPDC005917]|uniref:hypothetical protein n=1 Tax=unclassified Streptomyces TaxID=2593676 RepID=UPI0033D7B9B9